MWINDIVYFMKEAIGLIAISLNIIGTIPYVRSIYRGKTKPHLFSNIIWLVVTAIAFLGQVTKDAGPGAWTTGVATLTTLYILILAIKYGTKDVTRLDYVFLVLGLASIIPWILTDDPTISIVMATLVDVCGFIPTMRKTWYINACYQKFSIGYTVLSFSIVCHEYNNALYNVTKKNKTCCVSRFYSV